jgi:hypothetical protein
MAAAARVSASRSEAAATSEWAVVLCESAAPSSTAIRKDR